jgi:hypothetical protein
MKAMRKAICHLREQTARQTKATLGRIWPMMVPMIH